MTSSKDTPKLTMKPRALSQGGADYEVTESATPRMDDLIKELPLLLLYDGLDPDYVQKTLEFAASELAAAKDKIKWYEECAEAPLMKTVLRERDAAREELKKADYKFADALVWYQKKVEQAEQRLAEAEKDGWQSINSAPQWVYGNDALVGQYIQGYGWKKVTIWEKGWTRDECIERKATHWWPHLRELPVPVIDAAIAQEKPNEPKV